MGLTAVAAGARITAGMLNGLPASVAALATGSIGNSAAEAVIGTFVIPANDPGAAVGSGYHLLVSGSSDSAAGTATLTWRMRLNSLAGTNWWTAITVTPVTATLRPWWIDTYLYFTAAGAAATMNTNGYLNEFALAAGAGHAILSSPNLGTIDTTSAMTIVVTAQWSAAAAGNVCRTLTGSSYRI